MKNRNLHTGTKSSVRPYIVMDANGVEYLLPNYSESFRALMDDKEIIMDMLNSVLQLDGRNKIKDVKYQFEKPIDVFMPENDPVRLDAWVETRDRRFINIEVQNWPHAFILDRMQLYNAYLTLRSKYDYNRSPHFKSLTKKERRRRMYELPETISIWLCNFPILKPKGLFKDMWAVYSENDIRTGKALPTLPKNKYIIVDLPKFARLRKKVCSREDFWLGLLSKGPTGMPCFEDPVYARAVSRLRVSNVDPKILKSLEAKMSEDEHVMEVIKADAYLKGEAEGKKAGKKEGMEKGAERERRRIVKILRSKGVSPELLNAALAVK